MFHWRDEFSFLRCQRWRNERARVQPLEWGLVGWFLSDKIIFMLNVERDLKDNLFSLIQIDLNSLFR